MNSTHEPTTDSGTSPLTWIDHLMRVVAIFVVIGYSWLASVSLEPSFPQPKNLISEISWQSGARNLDWRDVRVSHFREVVRIAGAIQRSENSLRELGGLPTAVALVIDLDHAERYAVTPDRIELSLRIADQPDELERAFVKAWLFQTGDPTLVSSMFRTQAVSDIWTALHENTDLPRRSWLQTAVSYAGLCHSAWQAPELAAARCAESENISPFSFRPLIMSLIAGAQTRLSIRERLEFEEAWVHSLIATTDEDRGILRPIAAPETLEEWRLWLLTEIQVLIPRQKFQPAFRQALDAEIAASGLNAPAQIAVQSAVYTTAPFTTVAAVLKLDDEGGVLFPGRVRLRALELKGVKAPTLVWATCEAPKLSEILDRSLSSEHLLYVRLCGEPRDIMKSLARGGIRQLAKDHPDLPFVQLRREAVEVALRHGQMNLEDHLDRYMAADSASPQLGLRTAEWRRELKAFQVLGAIEAVEWFRAN